MDTIAVVGASERALALLGRLAESRFEVISISTNPARVRIALRRRLPSKARAAWLREARFESDFGVLGECSFVLDAVESDDEENRGRALAMIESFMSEGAVLASATRAPELVAANLQRPTQFVALEHVDRVPVAVPIDATAPGALFAAERLCTELSGRGTSTGHAHAVTELAEAG